jgi:hypothetical protein
MPSARRSAALLVALALVVAGLVAAAAPARADGFLVPTVPDRPVRGDWAVKYHRVEVQVRGPHASVTVEEEFVNLSPVRLEAEYVFPLPHGAMVSAVTLFENGRGLEGRLLTAAEARRVYDEIVRRQKDPALLEYVGRDLYRVSVFPIDPHQSRKVVLKYDQLLSADGGLFELLYPLNTEKFSAKPLENVVVSVDVEVEGALGPVYSPSHDVAIARPSKSRAQASFEARNVRPDADFLLYWSVTSSDVGASLLTHWPAGEDRGYFLFLASPSVADGEARAARLKALGGTNIEGALTAALSVPVPSDMASAIVFLTDGRPTVGIDDPDEIVARVAKANAAKGVRIFAFGVGVDVNTVLLDRLAVDNHGSPAYVRPTEDVEPKVASLYQKIRYPVLTDLRLDLAGIRATEVLPGVVPDLFRGGQVVIAGRYAKGGRSEMVLAGKDGAVTREYHYVLSAAEAGRGITSDFPARVWATRRIAELLDAIRLKKSQDKELVDEIVRLSTRFGILTEYTSFLADDGVDLARVAENVTRTRAALEELGEKDAGGAGFAQGANQTARRGADRAPAAPAFYLGAKGDRDVDSYLIEGVRQVANRTFYRRGDGWVDVKVADLARLEEKVQEIVVRWSPRFFELLKSTSADENARLAQAGPLVLELQGRVVRIVDGA